MLAVYLLFSVACFLTVHEHLRKDYLVTVNYDEDGSIGVVAVYNPPRFQENDGADE